MTHPPNERNKTRRNKSEDGRRRGKKSNGRNVVVYVVVTFLAMMIQNKVVRSKDLVFAFAVGVLLLRVVGIQSCVPLLLIKWQKQERIMKMTKNMTSSFWVIVEKIENSQKIALFFAFFSRQAFFFWRLRGMYLFLARGGKNIEIKCHVSFSLFRRRYTKGTRRRRKRRKRLCKRWQQQRSLRKRTKPEEEAKVIIIIIIIKVGFASKRRWKPRERFPVPWTSTWGISSSRKRACWSARNLAY